MTVLYGASMDGYKFKPLVIGKSANPRCFGHRFDKSTLPVHYYHSTSAWMTKDIFFDWFCNHFEPEVAQHFPGLTVHVLLDNCRAHPPKEELDIMFPNIKIWMLPPNTTALIQPMDMGIIYSAKSRFKKLY